MAINRAVSARHPSHPCHPLYYLPPAAQSLIDVGCNVGALLADAHERGIRRSFGIDINPESIKAAKKALVGLGDKSEVAHASADDIPAPDAAFDVATCCEVIEHVPSELRPAVFREVHRVLKPGGRFILTTPSAGLFAFLDPSNVRFRFSALYRIADRWAGGKGREAGYVGQKHDVVWHEHFQPAALSEMLHPGFVVETVRFRGAVLAPLCETALFPFYRRQRLDALAARTLIAIRDFELRHDAGKLLGYNILIVARSVPGASGIGTAQRSTVESANTFASQSIDLEKRTMHTGSPPRPQVSAMLARQNAMPVLRSSGAL